MLWVQEQRSPVASSRDEDVAEGNTGCGRSAGVGVGSSRAHRETATAGTAAQAVQQDSVGILVTYLQAEITNHVYTMMQ